ncbi:MAG: type II secretion system protein [Armatimonadetes bacterium]|nr:type II secretion system protein [Armatimonadota bacterium]
MRKINAFTLTEVIIAIGILVTLVALLYPALTSAKEKGIEASCASRLRQIRVALMLYGEDYPGYKRVSPTVDVPWQPMWLCQVLLPYLGNDKMALHCPAAPPCAVKYWESTYEWSALGLNTNGDPRYLKWQEELDRRYEDANHPYPLVKCVNHDEVFYYPSERHLAQEFNPPFVIRLYEAGNVKAGRMQMGRGFLFAQACAH